MQTITFTADDNVSQLLQDIAKENNKPTNEIIAESLRYYADMLQRKKVTISVPLFEKEGLGEIFKINPPQSPFFKGGGEYIRKKLQQQIKYASNLVAKQSLQINQSLAASNADALVPIEKHNNVILGTLEGTFNVPENFDDALLQQSAQNHP
jgi:hypothetical protein